MNTQALTRQANRQTTKVKYLTLTGLMAAMIALMTAYICHIPFGANGGYIHFGDSFIYIAAAILPPPYALAAAAIGGGIADLLTAPMWTPATIIIKMLITIPFTNKAARLITTRNVIATFIAYWISHTGYFFAEYILFESFSSAFFGSIGGIIQSGGSAVFFLVFGLALDRVHIKAKLANQLAA